MSTVKGKNIRTLRGGGAEVIEIEVGEPRAREVQIRTTACGICSWDMQTFKSGSDWSSAAPPGHEGIGVITKLGTGVRGFKIGEKVCGGGFASVQNVHTSRIYKIPETTLADHHWIVEPVSCCVTGIDHCQAKPGERIAIVGCGFMGLMILQGLKGVGLDQLIALDVDDARLRLAAQMGATEAHNTAAPGFDAVARDLARRRIDTVVDTSGAQPGLDLATAIVKPAGKINLFGWIKGERASFNPTAWHGKAISIVNSSPAAQMRDPFPPAIRMINQGVISLKHMVTHVVPIDEYPEFMAGVTSGQIKGYIKGVVVHDNSVAATQALLAPASAKL